MHGYYNIVYETEWLKKQENVQEPTNTKDDSEQQDTSETHTAEPIGPSIEDQSLKIAEHPPTEPAVPTQAPTESPTQSPTEAPTQAPTQAPTETSTQAPDTGNEDAEDSWITPDNFKEMARKIQVST